ncbi:hypothetical protein NPIL_256851 [Nephila pilipes]|uniref:Uncharacterized protein n=1 Tax=Nephila pilipes TaxID=299642 RepID=A0A8X6NGM2_NEPPI|nr:hypothetical protein NPIL_256851 [Nephila pilipes]
MDKQKRFEFCADMQLCFENDDFADRPVFTDEATFYISGRVNMQNVHFWGPDNLKFTEQHVRDSPELQESIEKFILQLHGVSPHWPVYVATLVSEITSMNIYLTDGLDEPRIAKSHLPNIHPEVLA